MGHNYNDSINFSFKKDLETIKSLPKEKRWKYIWDYYKIIILVLPVALIVLLILGSFCVNMVKGTFFPKDPVSIGIAVSGYSASPDWLQSCEEAIGCDPKREYLQILESPPYSTERDDFVIKSTLWLTAGQPDIFIVDEDGYEYLLSLDILADLSRDWQRNCRRFLPDTRSQSMPSKFPAPPSPENTAFRMNRSTCVCSPMVTDISGGWILPRTFWKTADGMSLHTPEA